MPKPEPTTLIFELERETKHKVRFWEVEPVKGSGKSTPVNKDNAVCERLYVSKKWLKAHGNPEVLHVTVQAP